MNRALATILPATVLMVSILLTGCGDSKDGGHDTGANGGAPSPSPTPAPQAGLQSISITPANAQIYVIADPEHGRINFVQLTCVGSFSNGFTQSLIAEWKVISNEGEGILSYLPCAELSATGLVTTVRGGTLVVEAQVGEFTAQATVKIIRLPVRLAIRAPYRTLYRLGTPTTVDLTCTASYDDSSDGEVEVQWMSKDGPVATVAPANGLQTTVTAGDAGTATIKATMGALFDETTISVRGIASLDIKPHLIPTLAVGAPFDLTCTATFDNGVRQYVDAHWSSPDDETVTIPPADVYNPRITAAAPGTATIEAAMDGKVAQTSVTVVASPLQGPFYAGDHDGTVRRYPVDGSEAVKVWSWNDLPVGSENAINGLWWRGQSGSSGLLLDRVGSALYLLVNVTDDSPPEYIDFGQLVRIDLATGSASRVANILPEAFVDGFFIPGQLSFDSQDRIYTHDIFTGKLFRVDPSTGQTVIVTRTGSQFDEAWIPFTGTEVGPDDRVYHLHLDSTSLYRSELSAFQQVPIPWAPAPADAVQAGGMAIDDNGDIYITESATPKVWKCRDGNADGDAMDPGEQTLFAEIPTDIFHGAISNITRAYGGFLVNSDDQQPDGQPGTHSVYWVGDLDGDGVASTIGEVVLIRKGVQVGAHGIGGTPLAAPHARH